jgi:hypothetical protein
MAGTGATKTSRNATRFALLLWGWHNPLIRRYFLGVFRFAGFAQMALADAGNRTHSSQG